MEVKEVVPRRDALKRPYNAYVLEQTNMGLTAGANWVVTGRQKIYEGGRIREIKN